MKGKNPADRHYKILFDLFRDGFVITRPCSISNTLRVFADNVNH